MSIFCELKDVYEHLKVIKGEQMYKDVCPRWEDYLKSKFGFEKTAFDKMETYRAMLETVRKGDIPLPNQAQHDALDGGDAEKIKSYRAVLEEVTTEDSQLVPNQAQHDALDLEKKLDKL